MRELLEQIAKALVDDPDAVRVLETQGEHACVLTLHVAKGDLGKLIGKRGAHAQAMRTLLAAASGKLDKRYTLEIAAD
jgi:predicted RNA-binding protein YlqC (UPF0109 family)